MLLRVHAQTIVLTKTLIFFLSVLVLPESLVPLRLQGIGDQAVVGIHAQIAAARQFDFVLGALDGLVAECVGFIQTALALLLDRERHFQGHRRDGLHQNLANGSVQGRAGNSLAHGPPLADSFSLADVFWNELPLALRIPHRHPQAADPADDHALEQRRSLARRTLTALLSFGGRVLKKLALIFFKLLPREIAWMRVSDQRQPLLTREFPISTDERLGLLLAPTIDEGACIARAMEQPQRTRVVQRAPEELAFVRTVVDSAREAEVLRTEGLDRRHRRAGAAKRLKDDAQTLLHLLVGVEPDATRFVI